MNKISILIASNFKLFRQLLIPVLRENHFHIIEEAEDCIQLLCLLDRHKPDIVIVEMPIIHMDGVNAFTKIRALYPILKIIVICNHIDTALVNFCYLKGVSAVLSKNEDFQTLVSAIKNVHQKSYFPIIINDQLNTELIKFSQREMDLIPLIIDGKTNKEIADYLKIGSKTVEAHKKTLFSKTKTHSAIGFVCFALKCGYNYLK